MRRRLYRWSRMRSSTASARNVILNEAATAGLDGLIVPTCRSRNRRRLIDREPPCRAQADSAHHADHAPRKRAIQIAGTTTGFIYLRLGRGDHRQAQSLPADLVETVAWLRTQTDLPICIGFGIGRRPRCAGSPGGGRPDCRQRNRHDWRRRSTGPDPKSSARSASSSAHWPRCSPETQDADFRLDHPR